MAEAMTHAAVSPAESQPGQRYAAFISYSHADEEFGDWLHRKLETYSVPSPLVGRDSPVGAIGKRLGKVFRDRAELSAAHDLAGEIREGLEAADALIVLCSPRSYGSKYVHEEIRIFKQMGKGQRIFAAIIDGEPHAAGRPGYTAADECFPPPLIYALGTDGLISSQLEPNEPIAADFREGKDGRENGSLKIIAGLLDVGLDELVQRERQAERGRRRRANAIAAGMGVLALIAAGAGGVAWIKQGEATRSAEGERRQAGIARRQQGLAEVSAQEALMRRNEAVRERVRADFKAEEARVSALAARRGEASAQTALARIFVEHGWASIANGDFMLAARYAIAGWRTTHDIAAEWSQPINSDTESEFRTLLGYVLQDSGEYVEAPPEPSVLAGNGSRGVVAAENGFQVVDLTSGRELFSIDAGAPITAAWISENGARVATVSGRTVTVWDLGANISQRALARVAHPDDVTAVRLNPDGSRLLTSCADNLGRMWDAATGAHLFDLASREPEPEPDSSIVYNSFVANFTPMQTRLLTLARGGVMRLWDASNGREIARLGGHVDTPDSAEAFLHLNEATISGLEFNPDGTRFVSSAWDGTARVWDTMTGREIAVLRAFQGRRSYGPSHAVRAAWAKDGAFIATSAAEDNVARLWPAADLHNPVPLVGHAAEVFDIGFNEDGSRLVTASDDGTARVWDVATGAALFTMRAGEDNPATDDKNEGEVSFTSFERGGARIRTFSGDETERSWRANGPMIARLNGPAEDSATQANESWPYDVRFEGDGRFIVGEYESGELVWTRDGAPAPFLSDRVIQRVNVTRDGARLATIEADGLHVWDTATGRELLALPRFGGIDQDATIVSAALTADGRGVFVSTDFEQYLIDVATGQQIGPRLRDVGAERYVYTPDGSRLVSSDAGIALWDANTGREIASFNGASSIEPPIINRDGSGFVTRGASSYTLLSADGAQLLESSLSSLAINTSRIIVFSPDGARLAALSDNQKGVSLWDARTGQLITETEPQSGNITSIVFSPDGRYLATASEAGAVRVLDATTFEEARHFNLGEDAAADDIDFSPDGARLASASYDGWVRVWDVYSSHEIARFHAPNVDSVRYSPDGRRVLAWGFDSAPRIWDVTRLAQPMEALARDACAGFLTPFGRSFSAPEINLDPLIRQIWMRDGRNPAICDDT